MNRTDDQFHVSLSKDYKGYHISLPKILYPFPDSRDAHYSIAYVATQGTEGFRHHKIVVAGTFVTQLKYNISAILRLRELHKILGEEKDEIEIAAGHLDKLLSLPTREDYLIRLAIVRYLRERQIDLLDPPASVLEILGSFPFRIDQLLASLNELRKQSFVKIHEQVPSFKVLQQYELKSVDKLFATEVNLNEAEAEQVDKYIERLETRDSPTLSNKQGKRPIHDPYEHYKIIEIVADSLTEGFAFHMIPFGGVEEQTFFDCVKPFCKKELDLDVVISKEENKPINLNNTVISHIHKCKFAIADITSQNPNVLYEIGFAHAINKDVIILCDANKRPAKDVFDIDKINTKFYESAEDLRNKLKKAVLALNHKSR